MCLSTKSYKAYPQKSKEKQNTVETVQATDPDTHMTQMLELLDREFKIATINMLKALIKMRITCNIDGLF